jgi:hypothetical protein
LLIGGEPGLAHEFSAAAMLDLGVERFAFRFASLAYKCLRRVRL